MPERFPDRPPTKKQLEYIANLAEYVSGGAAQLGEPAPEPYGQPSNRGEASAIITQLELAKVRLETLHEKREKAAAAPPKVDQAPAKKSKLGCSAILLAAIVGAGLLAAALL